jgi:hypothetical protein
MCHFALLHSHIDGCELFQKRMLLLQGSALKFLVETKARAWAFEKVCSAGANPSEKKRLFRPARKAILICHA